MKLHPTALILAAAVLAGGAGLALSVYLDGGTLHRVNPLLGSEVGQRAVQGVLTATAPTPPPGVAVAGPGDALPALRLPDLDGREHAVADRDGRPLLINFWASWCAPCIEEMPLLDAFARAEGAAGIQVLGIALDDAATVRAFLATTPVTYRILLDIAGPADSSVRLGDTHGVLPYSVLVDADGRIVKSRFGPFVADELQHWARLD